MKVRRRPSFMKKVSTLGELLHPGQGLRSHSIVLERDTEDDGGFLAVLRKKAMLLEDDSDEPDSPDPASGKTEPIITIVTPCADTSEKSDKDAGDLSLTSGTTPGQQSSAEITQSPGSSDTSSGVSSMASNCSSSSKGSPSGSVSNSPNSLHSVPASPQGLTEGKCGQQSHLIKSDSGIDLKTGDEYKCSSIRNKSCEVKLNTGISEVASSKLLDSKSSKTVTMKSKDSKSSSCSQNNNQPKPKRHYTCNNPKQPLVPDTKTDLTDAEDDVALTVDDLVVIDKKPKKTKLNRLKSLSMKKRQNKVKSKQLKSCKTTVFPGSNAEGRRLIDDLLLYGRPSYHGNSHDADGGFCPCSAGRGRVPRRAGRNGMTGDGLNDNGVVSTHLLSLLNCIYNHCRVFIVAGNTNVFLWGFSNANASSRKSGV